MYLFNFFSLTLLRWQIAGAPTRGGEKNVAFLDISLKNNTNSVSGWDMEICCSVVLFQGRQYSGGHIFFREVHNRFDAREQKCFHLLDPLNNFLNRFFFNKTFQWVCSFNKACIYRRSINFSFISSSSKTIFSMLIWNAKYSTFDPPLELFPFPRQPFS